MNYTMMNTSKNIPFGHCRCCFWRHRTNISLLFSLNKLDFLIELNLSWIQITIDFIDFMWQRFPIDVPFLFKLKYKCCAHIAHSIATTLCTLSWHPFVIRFVLIYFSFFSSSIFEGKEEMNSKFIKNGLRSRAADERDFVNQIIINWNFICKWFVFRQIEHREKCPSSTIWLIVFTILFENCLQTASLNHHSTKQRWNQNTIRIDVFKTKVISNFDPNYHECFVLFSFLLSFCLNDHINFRRFYNFFLFIKRLRTVVALTMITTTITTKTVFGFLYTSMFALSLSWIKFV